MRASLRMAGVETTYMLQPNHYSVEEGSRIRTKRATIVRHEGLSQIAFNVKRSCCNLRHVD